MPGASSSSIGNTTALVHEAYYMAGRPAGTSVADHLSNAVLVALDDSLRRMDQGLGVSPATVKRGRGMAQAWLFRDLQQTVEGAR